MSTFSILIVDDEAESRRRLGRLLAEEDLTEEAEDGALALAWMEKRSFDLVLLDQRMPGLPGLEVLRRIKKRSPDVDVIMVTAVQDRATIVACIKNGAEDFIVKPIQLQDLKQKIRNLKKRRSLIAENQRLKSELDRRARSHEIVGESAAIGKVLDAVDKVAAMPTPVVIHGESGSGKELIARAIHQNSPRRGHRFLAVNCGSFVDSLLATELFGHTKGAFTDGREAKRGLFHAAEGGTLFLDEISETSAKFQVQLLRVLETAEVLPVGSTTPRAVDTRIIVATNRNLEERVATGTFRQDLYYRLWRFPVRVPALRERSTDIPLLARHFLRYYAETLNKQVLRFTDEAMQALVRYDWPGNVRELKAVVERAVILAEHDEVCARHLSMRTGGVETVVLPSRLFVEPWREAKKQFERIYILRALREAGDNVSQASRNTGMDRKNFHDKMRVHNIIRSDSES